MRALLLLLSVLVVDVLGKSHFSPKLHKRIAPDTYSLGERTHPHDPSRRVSGVAFLHTHKHHAPRQPSRAKDIYFKRQQNNTRKRASADSCTSPIAAGAVWKTSRGYYINAKNAEQLTQRYVVSALAEASDAWNCILKNSGRMVIGPLLAVRPSLSGNDIDITEPDGFNVVGFGSIMDKPGTVAVTTVWGIFNGPVAMREIVEFDMLYDQEHYSFGNSSVRVDVIDFGATSTHEWGHALGLDDIYSDGCSEVTMYGSSSENETKKRTLEQADQTGLSDMYGTQF